MPRRIFPAVCRKPRTTSLACTHTLKMAVALNNLLQRRPSCSDELLMPPDASLVPCVESHARTHAMKMAVALDKCSCQSHARTHACSCSACPRGVMSSSHRVSKPTLQHHAAPAEREHSSFHLLASFARLLVSRKSCPRLKTKSVTQTSMRLAPGVSSSNSWRPCSPRAVHTQSSKVLCHPHAVLRLHEVSSWSK